MMDFRFVKALLALALAALSIGYAAPASAQATRTWVSGVGDDVNPCSRTAPCKTFAGAIPKTAAGGEIDCLDPGGFGAVTITKSITLFCPFTDGGIVVSGTSAIIVNDGGAGTAQVTIDGLNLEGLGFSTAAPGIYGISFVSGASLTVKNTRIRGFRDPTVGAGISFTPGGPALLTVVDSEITGNGITSAGGGILVQPTGTGSARVTVTDTVLSNNGNAGFRVSSVGNVGGNSSFAVLQHVTINGSPAGVAALQTVGTAPVLVAITDSVIANNANFGLVASGAGARVRIGGSLITNSGTAGGGLNGSAMESTGNNIIVGNVTSNGTFTLVPTS